MQRTPVIMMMVLLSVGWLIPSIAEDAAPKPPSRGMDIKFEDVEITHALQTISKASGLIIAVEMGLNLDGKVDLTWNTLDWRDGLTRALAQVGLTWDETPIHIIVME